MIQMQDTPARGRGAMETVQRYTHLRAFNDSMFDEFVTRNDVDTSNP
jgi:hypothetical protein